MIGFGKPVVDPVNGYKDSMAVEQPNLGVSGSEIIFDVDTMYLDIEAEGGGDIHFYLDGEYKTLDCTTGLGVGGKARVTLQNGLDDWINSQVVYAYYDGQAKKIQLSSSTVIPVGSFLPIAYVGILSFAKTQLYGPMLLQRVTEAISHGGQGSISRMREHTRLAEAKRWWNGCETSYAGSTDNLTSSVKMLSGEFYQMNKQTIDELDTSIDGYFVVDSENEVSAVKNYTYHTNLNDMKYLADGTEITTGEFIALYVYAVGNNCPENCKLVIHTPGHSHSTLSDLKEFVSHSKAPSIDNVFRTVSFPIGVVLLKYLGSGEFENAFTTGVETIEWSWKTYALDIKSLNYPSNYTNNIDTNYQVTGPVDATKLQLVFYAFNTENNYDKLYYREGTSYPTTSYPFWDDNLGAFGSQVFNNRVVSLKFKTDGSVTRSGWMSNHYKAWVPETIISTEQSIKMIDARGK